MGGGGDGVRVCVCVGGGGGWGRGRGVVYNYRGSLVYLNYIIWKHLDCKMKSCTDINIC